MGDDKKILEEAELFLFFVRKIRQCPLVDSYKIIKKGGIHYIPDDLTGKYKCIYCGSSYVYKRGLVSHMDRLHNISKKKNKKLMNKD